LIEKSLKTLVLLNAAILIAAYLVSWAQHPIASAFGMRSPLQLFVMAGGVAVLLSLFADTCIIFYFVGTAVWIRDRSQELVKVERNKARTVYSMYQQANKLKARTFPFATLGIALALFSFILSGGYQVGAVPLWMLAVVGSLWLLNTLGALKFYFTAIDKNLHLLDLTSDTLESV